MEVGRRIAVLCHSANRKPRQGCLDFIVNPDPGRTLYRLTLSVSIGRGNCHGDRGGGLD